MAPWTDKTGLAKATAILATIALVSLGLCGGNAFLLGVADSGVMGSGLQSRIGTFVIVAGFIELAGIVLSTAGLVLVGMVALVRAIMGYGPETKATTRYDDLKKEN